MIVSYNPDTEFVSDLKHEIKANGGYCPSVIERNKNTKCKCKEFKDQIARGEAGYCRCGLYVAEEE